MVDSTARRLQPSEIRSLVEPCLRENRAQRLRLRQADAGWSLMGPGGDVVFHAEDPGGRRACLTFASEHGIAALFS